jgi:hypothetical protein
VINALETLLLNLIVSATRHSRPQGFWYVFGAALAGGDIDGWPNGLWDEFN